MAKRKRNVPATSKIVSQQRTSNRKIHISKTVYYYIVIKLREKKDATKGSRKYSKGYPSLFVAEEAAF